MTNPGDEGRPPDPGSAPPPPPPPSYQPPPDQAAPSPPPYQYGPGYGQPARTEGTAIASVVVGVVGLLALGIILGIAALVLANVANKRIQESGGTLGGQGLVTAGRILGVVDIALAVIVIFIIIGD